MTFNGIDKTINMILARGFRYALFEINVEHNHTLVRKMRRNDITPGLGSVCAVFICHFDRFVIVLHLPFLSQKHSSH